MTKQRQPAVSPAASLKSIGVRRGAFALEVTSSKRQTGIERIARYYFRGELPVSVGAGEGESVPLAIGGVAIRSKGRSFALARSPESWLTGTLNKRTGLGHASGTLLAAASAKRPAPEVRLMVRLSEAQGRIECISDPVLIRVTGQSKAAEARIFFLASYPSAIAGGTSCQIGPGWFADLVCDGDCVGAGKTCVIFWRRKGSSDDWQHNKDWTWIWKADPNFEYRCGCV